MYFCIRDDDTNFYTSPDELEQSYGEVTRFGPVSLAVVPFQLAGTSGAVPESLRGTWTTNPLHKNSALVRYLRDGALAGRYEIMLHGYHHDERSARPEYTARRDLAEHTSSGRKYLEDLLSTSIRVFVPPHNSIGKEGLRAVIRANLHLGCTAGVRSGWPFLSPKTWRLWHQLRQWERTGGVGIPWVLDLGDHREIAGNAVTPVCSFGWNQKAFESASKVNGVFCLATHYWELSTPSKNLNDPPVGEHLRYFVERARLNPEVTWQSVGDTLCQTSAVI